MAEQNRRMTYEEQRALRDQQRADSASQRDAAAQRSSQARRSASRKAASQRVAQRQPQSAEQRQSQRAARGSSRRQPQGQTQRAAKRQGAVAAKPLPIFKIALLVVLIVIVVLAVRLCTSVMPINVTVNGTSYELRGAKTVQTAIKTSGLPINPGDLISLHGAVLEKSAGNPFYAKVNGEETVDPDYALHDGDVLDITDGKDIVEDYDVVESAVPYGTSIVGVGAVHKFEEGVEGLMETHTGRLSGETVERQTVDPVNTTCTRYNLNTGADKVIAFTFDDGPTSEYTAQILNILKENDAKATFFCIGTEVESFPALVKREYDEGHQVCTHSYDHADPVGGVDLGAMDAAGQIDEIVRGMQTIADATGVEASRVVRMPGGNLSEEMVANLWPYVDYEIGWNVDTSDWTMPGADAIYQVMISADPGDIILCHDGGGDRSETVEALKKALPYLKSKGFTFVTMDEILQYPAKT